MDTVLTQRQKFILAVLSIVPDLKFSPVQVQKLFFLIDQEQSGFLGKRYFSFRPYDYGPFDKNLYVELENLNRLGLVHVTPINPTAGRRTYSVTDTGRALSEDFIEIVPDSTKLYVRSKVEWIRRLTFAQLVGAIYKMYPSMKENSVFD